MSKIEDLIDKLSGKDKFNKTEWLAALDQAATLIRQCRERGFIDENGEARKSRMYWRYDADEGESGYDSPDEIGDACDIGEVFRVQVAVPLPDEYYVATVNPDGTGGSRLATPAEVELWKEQHQAWKKRATVLPDQAAAAAKEARK